MRSTTKVWVFLALASFLTILLGAKLYDRAGLIVGFVIAVVFDALILLTDRHILLHKLKAHEVVGQDPWGLLERLVKWSHELALPSPRLYISDSTKCIAFVSTSPWGDTAICLSEGVIKKLSLPELEALIVQQLCQILRLSDLSFSIASLFADSLLTFSHLLDQSWLLRKITRKSRTRPFEYLLSPIAWFFIRLNVRESLYFAHDDLAAQVLPNRKILAQTLWKLDSLNQAQPLDIPLCSRHLFVVNPLGLREQGWYTTSHPQMSLRLKRLVGYEPL